MEEGIAKVTVVGAGAMGAGIAQKIALAGLPVELIDLGEDILEGARKRITANLQLLAETQYISAEEAATVLPNISLSTDLSIVRHSPFVLEAVPENLDLKRQIFKELDALCPAETILATNSSTLRISQIAAATARPDKVIGVHWVNPPYLIPLVEVICADETSQETVDACLALLRRVKVVPGLCRKDVPGFVINRIQKVILNEILSLAERGVVSLEDADNIVWLALGARLALAGPLRINDLIANKSQSLHGFGYMYRETGDPRFKPSRLMEEKVARGELGISTGKGWYDYSGKDKAVLAAERDRAFIKIINFLRKEGFYPPEIC